MCQLVVNRLFLELALTKMDAVYVVLADTVAEL